MLRRIAAVAFCLMPCAELVAQNPASSGHAVLHGVVVDSVRGGFLRGATVGLLGPSRMTFTDSRGRFRIDSIPPGDYQVALFDPLLDTLSLGVVSPLGGPVSFNVVRRNVPCWPEKPEIRILYV